MVFPEASQRWPSLNLAPVPSCIAVSYWVNPMLNLTLTVIPYDRGHIAILETRLFLKFLYSLLPFSRAQAFLG